MGHRIGSDVQNPYEMDLKMMLFVGDGEGFVLWAIPNSSEGECQGVGARQNEMSSKMKETMPGPNLRGSTLWAY
jgi:hypothetical protein